MTPERWQQIHAVFSAAVPLDPAQREDYLDRACAHDAVLRAEVAELLAQDEQAEREGFLAATPDPPLSTPSKAAGPYHTRHTWLLEQAGPEPRPVWTAAASRYQPLRFHARGGLGEVFVARDEELGREVALKRIRTERAEDPENRRRFLREAEITGRLEHPGIVPVHGLLREADGRLAYAMRLIAGQTLQEAIGRFHEADRSGRAAGQRRLAFRQLLSGFVAVCNTVAYAHSRGVVHRDIKPSNILLGAYGETFLVDWGLAKRQAPEEPTAGGDEAVADAADGTGSRMGCPMGTPAYMSPEQAAGRWDVLGPAGDIYSLGATLYALLTGQAPYPDGSVGEILAGVQRGACPPPRAVKRDTPRALDAVCHKAMALSPEERYATALALAAEVEHWLADEPLSAYRERWPARLARWGRRHKAWVASAAALLVSAVVGLSAGLLLLQRANRRTEEQAAIATAVKDFLQSDLLRQADSWEQADRHFTPDPHVEVRTLLDRAATGIGERFREKPLVAAAIRQAIGDAYQGVGAYERAIEHLSAAGKLLAAHLGPEHPDTLKTMNNLASAYEKGGRTAEAIPLLEQVRPQLTKKLGPDHPDTLGALNNLACAYRGAGRTTEAIPLFEQVRQQQMQSLGPDHPHTLTTLHNLACAYLDAGRTAEAIPLFEQVRAQQTKTLGPDHPDTLTTLNSLAGAYLVVRRLAEAIPLLEQVRQQQTQTLGPDHPRTLTTLNSLAGGYLETGRSAEAIPLFAQVWAQQTKTLGPDHPHTLLTLINLAGAYRDSGRFAEAIPRFEQARAQMTKKLGPNHPDTLLTLHNLAETYRDAGRRAEAIPLLEQVWEQRTQALGPEHPITVTTLRDLARLYVETGRGAEAMPLFEQVRAQQTKTLGPAHPDTLTTLNDLARAYQEGGKLPEAIRLLEQVRDQVVEKLGLEHPVTVTTLGYLAGAYWDADRRAEAIPLLEHVRAQHMKTLGPDHPHTWRTLGNLALAYRSVGRSSEAIPLLEQVRAQQTKTLGPDHPATLATLGSLTAAFRAAKQFDRALAAYEEALEIRGRGLPADDPARADALIAYGDCLLEAGKAAEAESVLRQGLTIRENKQPDDWTTFNAKSLLGRSLAGQKKYADAEPLLLQGHEGLQQRQDQIPAKGKVRLTEALDRLVQLYEDWGKPEDAARWRARREQLPKPEMKKP
jgi:tetratricopeptide (TPR) repeat protein/tRNA A-37 threonylcarbamoyl transferase component Bud32